MTSIESAPKDRRILAYGVLGLESEPGWGTVKWCSTYDAWYLDPTEATEYDPEKCNIWHWQDLPALPENLQNDGRKAPVLGANRDTV
jgi:hypothetical protein